MLKYLNILDNLLSLQECGFLIKFCEKLELKEIDRGIAKYFRAEFDNDYLANLLFQRLKHRGVLSQYWNGKKIVGLNTHFRFSKYHDGMNFDIHKDGFNADRHGNRSVMTLNIFLNDEFEGGDTDFLLDDRKTLRLSAKPKPGRAALFDSQQYHRGNTVKNGFKYLLRTDVMVSV